jgi:hypothetical protein
MSDDTHDHGLDEAELAHDLEIKDAEDADGVTGGSTQKGALQKGTEEWTWTDGG